MRKMRGAARQRSNSFGIEDNQEKRSRARYLDALVIKCSPRARASSINVHLICSNHVLNFSNLQRVNIVVKHCGLRMYSKFAQVVPPSNEKTTSRTPLH